MTRILVVDDEADILHLISLCLSARGYQTMQAKSKSELLPLLTSFQPDVIILDVMLGDEDGRTICKEINQTDPVHVILTSAVSDVLINYEQWGADDTLEKPFPIPLLLQKINKVLQLT